MIALLSAQAPAPNVEYDRALPEAGRREPSVAQLLRNAEKNRDDLRRLERIADDFARKVSASACLNVLIDTC